MKHMDMEKFANGAFTSQINRELEKVTENIQDPNTDATAKRRITVVIEFKPNEARNFVTTGVQAKSTLAPALGAVTALNMGKDLKTGEVEAVEIGNQIPGQMSIDDVETPQAVQEEDNHNGELNAMVRTVDQSTGEIYETPASSNVIDLRGARQA
ncbi:hypothetical protein [Blautia producta]|uniref:Replication terminator protein n=2 Tax=Blautia producta TaxID=33035 RepID=A0A7G5N2X3_9FIRM|nr:hypothetical protein [Blautia producta]QIB56049.1 hypothetical protein GXM18_14940 [Blautia producta ATCC 27340 = DSM 2950]QMW81216.1 hypothetical protein E5259_28655 [Blautia producta]